MKLFPRRKPPLSRPLATDLPIPSGALIATRTGAVAHVKSALHPGADCEAMRLWECRQQRGRVRRVMTRPLIITSRWGEALILECAPGLRAGRNKGVRRAVAERKRNEAETRNEDALPGRRRAARLAAASVTA